MASCTQPVCLIVCLLGFFLEGSVLLLASAAGLHMSGRHYCRQWKEQYIWDVRNVLQVSGFKDHLTL